MQLSPKESRAAEAMTEVPAEEIDLVVANVLLRPPPLRRRRMVRRRRASSARRARAWDASGLLMRPRPRSWA